MKPVLVVLALLATTACAAPYEAMPQSGYQWQRRQDAIEQDWRASQPAQAPAAMPAPKDKR
jgi:hypothetical protein